MTERINIRIFQIWTRKSEYIVLKCPNKDCECIFRWDISNLRAFGKNIKNAKCQKCEKLFPLENNFLDYDPLGNTSEEHVLRKEIVDGKEVKEENPLKKGKIPDIRFLPATEL